MEQSSELLGNPISLLLERIFWLGLGGFFGATIFRAVIHAINKQRKVPNPDMEKTLKNIAKQAKELND